MVVRVGASPGVLWEIEQALAHVPRSRLVLAILGGQVVSREIVDRLGSALGAPWAAILPQALPEVRRRTWLALFWSDPRRRLGSLVCFDASGRAHAVPIRLWPLRWRDFIASIGRPAAGPLRYAWREVFRILAMESGGDNRLLSRGMAVMLALSFGWSGAHWFYLGQRRRAWIYLFSVPLALLPLFLSWYDALRFIWIDRASFESLAAPDRLSSGTKEIR